MITGVWLDGHQYRMSDSRTGTTCMVAVMGAGYSDIVEQQELADLIMEAEEKFATRVKHLPDKLPMARSMQHDMGATLKEIKQSRTNLAEVGHGRYW